MTADRSPDSSIESPLFPSRIETDRIEFVPAGPETADPFEFYEYTGPDGPNVDEIAEFLPWTPNETVKTALDFLQETADDFRECEAAGYLVRPTDAAGVDRPDDDPAWAGMSSLFYDWDRRSAEWGVWLRKPFWGHGYATEAGGAMLALAFERTDLELVRIEHERGNDASNRMIERVIDRYGGRHEGLLRNQKAGHDGPRDMNRYAVSAGEYREATGGERAVDPDADPLVIEAENLDGEEDQNDGDRP